MTVIIQQNREVRVFITLSHYGETFRSTGGTPPRVSTRASSLRSVLPHPARSNHQQTGCISYAVAAPCTMGQDHFFPKKEWVAWSNDSLAMSVLEAYGPAPLDRATQRV